MFVYFLLIRIAALCGHKKAQALVRGQKDISARIRKKEKTLPQGAIWIHAASVGEFEQARPLIERLRTECPQKKIVVTFFSPSGYEMRKNYDRVDEVIYLPFATRMNARRFIAALKPEMAIFVKYEFWPAYLRELKKKAIPTYSISAIFRPTQRFFHWYGRTQLALLRCFTHIYVQDEASRRLLAEHGVHDCSVAGDTRFDRVSAISGKCDNDHEKRIIPIAEFTRDCNRVIIAGSTWPQDEELLAQFALDEHTKLIIVPHEIDEKHMHYIFNLFKGRFVRYSDVKDMQPHDSLANILRRAHILIIDHMGLLSSIYRYGHVAYIGGGFGDGIHNTIEAAVYGLPIIFGPNYHHFREAQGLIDAHAARSIKNYYELTDALITAINNYSEIGARAAAYVESEKGATEKIYNELFNK